MVETAVRHFADAEGLAMLTIDAERLGDGLRWEPSRGGDLFPHLYGPLPIGAVVAEVNLPGGVPVDRAVAEALGPGPAPDLRKRAQRCPSGPLAIR